MKQLSVCSLDKPAKRPCVKTTLNSVLPVFVFSCVLRLQLYTTTPHCTSFIYPHLCICNSTLQRPCVTFYLLGEYINNIPLAGSVWFHLQARHSVNQMNPGLGILTSRQHLPIALKRNGFVMSCPYCGTGCRTGQFLSLATFDYSESNLCYICPYREVSTYNCFPLSYISI